MVSSGFIAANGSRMTYLGKFPTTMNSGTYCEFGIFDRSFIRLANGEISYGTMLARPKTQFFVPVL